MEENKKDNLSDYGNYLQEKKYQRKSVFIFLF